MGNTFIELYQDIFRSIETIGNGVNCNPSLKVSSSNNIAPRVKKKTSLLEYSIKTNILFYLFNTSQKVLPFTYFISQVAFSQNDFESSIFFSKKFIELLSENKTKIKNKFEDDSDILIIQLFFILSHELAIVR